MPVAPVKAFYADPFNPVLHSSPPVVLTDEQRKLARAVLDVACSDTQFADKAYRALQIIFAGSSQRFAVVTSLTPNSAEIGDPSFTLHVHGTGFKNTDKIVFAGNEEPTTFVSPTELTTGVDMSVWLGADVLPVMIMSADGELSNAMDFTFVAPALLATSTESKTESKTGAQKVLHTPVTPSVTPHAVKTEPVKTEVKK